ncbi:MAG: HD-GYP domain-containing protein [Bdellovibrionales bacterium]
MSEAKKLEMNPFSTSIGGAYRSVALVDITPETTLDFDVYIHLPINNRYVKVIHAGQKITPDLLKKFHSYEVSRVFVSPECLDKYFSFQSQRFNSLINPPPASPHIDYSGRQREAVQSMFSGVLHVGPKGDQAEALLVLTDLEEVLNRSLGLSNVRDSHSSLLAQFNQPVGVAAKAGRVSTFAAMLEMALGLQQTHEAAVAGLFLDIGLMTLPEPLQSKPFHKLSAEERWIYETHPEAGLKLLQRMNIPVSESIQNVILNHHERVDGTGFPRKIAGSRISLLTQAVVAAERLDQLMFGLPIQMGVPEMMSRLRSEQVCSPDVLSAISSVMQKD